MALKIDKEWKTIHERPIQARTAEKPAEPFRHFVQSQSQKAEAAVIEALFAEIDEQGKRLSRSQTVRDMQIYKRLIRQYLQKAVSYGLSLKQSREWQFAQGQVQTLVKTIDERLAEMTELLLQKGQSSIAILDAVDEIKGLLINLYR
ncbi:YaaR family protein [Camelliibacillus cellulosilyticus]|uniref:YaaR family protein n=1 Tax=Camelliibacillus cellulosilyticus TaxID=2174486 RepID=A0ABV9GTK4_9BACL